MAENGVRVSNREIYDAVQRLDKTVGEYIAATDVRLRHLEERSAKRWHFWTAISASPLAGAALAWFGFKTGA